MSKKKVTKITGVDSFNLADVIGYHLERGLPYLYSEVMQEARTREDGVVETRKRYAFITWVEEREGEDGATPQPEPTREAA